MTSSVDYRHHIAFVPMFLLLYISVAVVCTLLACILHVRHETHVMVQLHKMNATLLEITNKLEQVTKLNNELRIDTWSDSDVSTRVDTRSGSDVSTRVDSGSDSDVSTRVKTRPGSDVTTKGYSGSVDKSRHRRQASTSRSNTSRTTNGRISFQLL